MKTHRLQQDIPTAPSAKRERLRWLADHKMWQVPVTLDEEDMALFDEDAGGLGVEGRTIHVSRMTSLVDIDWVHVDPETETIEDDDARNTAFRVWIEAGPMWDQSEGEQEPDGGWDDFNRWVPSHDTDLDCGAADLETALLTLAALVDVFYDPDTGDDRADRPKRCEGTLVEDVYASGCTRGDDGFCVRCGFIVAGDT